MGVSRRNNDSRQADSGAALAVQRPHYGVGCVAYCLLTGRLVFDGETAYQVVAQHLNAAAEPPSHRSPHAISAKLDEVILSCLEKDPAQRPQDALELSRRLTECKVDGAWTEAEAALWWRECLPHSEAPAFRPASVSSGWRARLHQE